MNKTQSISKFIRYTMIKTFFLIGILFLMINTTFLSKYKDSVIFEELNYAAENKFEYLDRPASSKDRVFHFLVRLEKGSLIITQDMFTEKHFSNNPNILMDVASSVLEDNENKGKIRYKSETIYFISESIAHREFMIFIMPIKKDYDVYYQLLFLFILFLFMSLYISKKTAFSISAPITQLEEFSEEISKKNWLVKKPIIKNDELNKLATTLENTKLSLEHADQRDREFLQSTSHDLKTPVMLIKGYAQAVLDGVTVNNTSSIQIILQEADRLERKIMQLLRLNTVDHTLEYSNQRSQVRLDRLLSSLCDKFKIISPHLDWVLDLDVLELLGDTENLKIAFENIFENQIRYAKSVIEIKLKNNNITFYNDGPPFEVEDPNILFDPYKKDQIGQYGLGLAIVKRVIQSHQGEIKAYNHKTGVIFDIVL